ncbi:ATP-dependent DNA helicase RecG [Apilactobacillus sp. TMW 2.2457]|uniref:ATP-dependent DNA helicase RecG n=1 Tax=Apilactobacillus xinyiensis TaxID=2841032 RepID=UPI00200F112E|nr:ATP-dependent DNA helicase RecG [Apilactobacillus xinyiensis]MCL0329435.1 ATP-dependent DNA helicase RecG [Apilactobacillus xinyiensis]
MYCLFKGELFLKSLTDLVSVLPGVGPKKAQYLNQLGIYDINNLLNYFPFRYENLQIKPINEIKDQEKVILKGKVALEPRLNFFGRKKNILNLRLLLDNDVVPVSFFNQPWLKKRIQIGEEILVYGRFNLVKKSLSGIKLLSRYEKFNSMQPIYSTNKNISQKEIVKLIKLAFEEYKDLIHNLIPSKIIEKYKLLNLIDVIRWMHFPRTKQETFLALRTAKFNEFFLFQMKLQSIKKLDFNHGIQIDYDEHTVKKFINHLPFQLTGSQTKVVKEILFDMRDSKQMNRLLQGDVGSGKTIVAATAIYAAITSGYQVALMVPTEVLAEQHANKLAKLFEPLGINVALLTGNTKPKPKISLLDGLVNGDIDLLIGTHALIQEKVIYNNLGLIIIDEQHRFGVNQRKQLRNKGKSPNVLSMTATPIPRTLAITAYGEMDVSIIDELPKGRMPIKTTWIRNNQFKSILPFVYERLQKHEQIYIVTPLIEDSDAVNMRNAEQIYQQFADIFQPKYKVGILHGKMKDVEKNLVMNSFKHNDFQILVSTTVIEVGVDVSNATVMIIFDAEHFGLAQLHQLRGRVGRGNSQSYCILVADPKNELGAKRMNVMVDNNNGFIISQKDLELRGPGDVIGNKQSGIPQFKVGDPVSDVIMLNIAQQEAIQIVSTKNWENIKENKELASFIQTSLSEKILD